MKSKITLLFPLIIAALALLPTACIEDDVTTSPSAQPVFSTDTLQMGEMFTGEQTPTYSFKVFNPNDKILRISHIGLRQNDGMFRLNVDGQSGREFSDVEIRPHDSIYVMVTVVLPENGSWSPVDVENAVVFQTNGVTSEVILAVEGQDVERIRGRVIESDETWLGDHPRQVFDSLVVAEGATLTLEAGTQLYFHDGSYLRVRGTLITRGTYEAPVIMTGDRRGNVVTDIPFDLMSRQWEGVVFSPSSRANRMEFTEIKNTWIGVVVDSVAYSEAEPSLSMTCCRLRNSAQNVLQSRHSSIEAMSCEFAEAGAGSVYIEGGVMDFNYCTISNYYLFSAITGPCLQLRHTGPSDDDASGQAYLRGQLNNSIIYGMTADMSPTNLDDTDVYVRRCLLRSSGTDDLHFIGILWGEDPMWYTDRTAYIFDYQLKPDSPCLGQADTALPAPPPTDFYGVARPSRPAIGAYQEKAGES